MDAPTDIFCQYVEKEWRKTRPQDFQSQTLLSGSLCKKGITAAAAAAFAAQKKPVSVTPPSRAEKGKKRSSPQEEEEEEVRVASSSSSSAKRAKKNTTVTGSSGLPPTPASSTRRIPEVVVTPTAGPSAISARAEISIASAKAKERTSSRHARVVTAPAILGGADSYDSSDDEDDNIRVVSSSSSTSSSSRKRSRTAPDGSTTVVSSSNTPSRSSPLRAASSLAIDNTPSRSSGSSKPIYQSAARSTRNSSGHARRTIPQSPLPTDGESSETETETESEAESDAESEPEGDAGLDRPAFVDERPSKRSRVVAGAESDQENTGASIGTNKILGKIRGMKAGSVFMANSTKRVANDVNNGRRYA